MTDDELNAEIDKLCGQKGLRFKPWEARPSDVHDGPCPWPDGSGFSETWSKAVALRRKLIAEIEARQKPKRPVARRAKPKDGEAHAIPKSTR